MEVGDVLGLAGIAAGATTLTVAVVAYVGRQLFEGWIEKSTKVAIERLRLEHQKDFHRFGKVYDRQADALAEIYASIVELDALGRRLSLKFVLQEEEPDVFGPPRIPEGG